MKRMYFPNREIKLLEQQFSITSGGTVYEVTNGTFKRAQYRHTKEGLFIKLDSATAFIWLEAGVIKKEIQDLEGKVLYTDRALPQEIQA